MRRLVVFVLSSFSACQCLQPVDERLDAGRDAGVVDGGAADGGLDVGLACTDAADCPAASPVLPFCGGLRPACVNHRCLLECPEPDAGLRTCTSDTAECLTCDGATRQCSMCNAPVCSFMVNPVQGTCPAPFDEVQQFSVQPFSGRCGGGVLRDGGLEGVWVGSLGFGRSLFDLPTLGGTCLGSPLATGAPRVLISCPACTFIAFGCE